MSFQNIVKIKTIMENDSFTKYQAIAEVKGEYIVCNDISKLKTYTKRIVKESYKEYLEFIKNRDYEKEGRIKTEQEAKDIDVILKHILRTNNFTFSSFQAEPNEIEKIADEIIKLSNIVM